MGFSALHEEIKVWRTLSASVVRDWVGALLSTTKRVPLDGLLTGVLEKLSVRSSPAPFRIWALGVALVGSAGAATLSGVVNVSPGHGIRASLSIHDLSTPRTAGHKPYDHQFASKADGSFSLTGVPAGKYRICVGRTPEPCTGLQLFSVAAEAALENGVRRVSRAMLYQVNSGRLGAEGQQVNAYLNKRQYTGPGLWPMATPYIWSAIEFAADGNVRPLLQGSTIQIFPTYFLYRNGQRVLSGSVAQLPIIDFIGLDWLSAFVLPF
jgi:hypothetical protein